MICRRDGADCDYVGSGFLPASGVSRPEHARKLTNATCLKVAPGRKLFALTTGDSSSQVNYIIKASRDGEPDIP